MKFDKIEILEELKMLWRSSENITYKDLEKIQKARYGSIIYKEGTLRNKASKEGWNAERGVEVLEALGIQQNDFIESNTETLTPELIGAMSEFEKFEILEKQLYLKYSVDFNKLRKDQSEILKLDITDKENLRKLKAIGEAIREVTKTMEEEKKLLGMVGKVDILKLELESNKLELLIATRISQNLGGANS